MTKPQLIKILTSFATVPNQNKTKMFIPADSIPEIAGKILELNKATINPTLEEVKAFFKEKGYSEDIAVTFYEGYSINDWKDSKDKPIKNWKQKAIQVWFKPEHKATEQPLNRMVL